MKDFTLDIYKAFLSQAIKSGYTLTSYEDFLEKDYKKVMVLRHDVDKLPENSLKTAQLQHELGVKGVYYFRAVPQSFDVEIIKEIANLGHEIGYHYEDMALCKGDYPKSIEHFEKWLNKLRAYYPVSTVCMHGSPASKWDNREIWKKYDYRDFDIKGEPYFDTDFNEVLYITDTGRRWDGSKVAVRDKVEGLQHNYASTMDLIEAFKKEEMPDRIMQNIHPQRWTNDGIEWRKEQVMQTVKNSIKKTFFVKK